MKQNLQVKEMICFFEKLFTQRASRMRRIALEKMWRGAHLMDRAEIAEKRVNSNFKKVKRRENFTKCNKKKNYLMSGASRFWRKRKASRLAISENPCSSSSLSSASNYRLICAKCCFFQLSLFPSSLPDGFFLCFRRRKIHHEATTNHSHKNAILHLSKKFSAIIKFSKCRLCTAFD